MYYTREGISLQKGEVSSLESFNGKVVPSFRSDFQIFASSEHELLPRNGVSIRNPRGKGGGGGDWSLRSRNNRGVDTELRFKTRRFSLSLSSFALALSLSSPLFSRSATTPSGTRDSAQADQQKRASPCLHLHSRERPSSTSRCLYSR